MSTTLVCTKCRKVIKGLIHWVGDSPAYPYHKGCLPKVTEKRKKR